MTAKPPLREESRLRKVLNIAEVPIRVEMKQQFVHLEAIYDFAPFLVRVGEVENLQTCRVRKSAS